MSFLERLGDVLKLNEVDARKVVADLSLFLNKVELFCP